MVNLLNAPSSGRRPEPLSRILAAGDGAMLDEVVYRIGGSRVIREKGQNLPLGIRVLAASPICRTRVSLPIKGSRQTSDLTSSETHSRDRIGKQTLAGSYHAAPAGIR